MKKAIETAINKQIGEELYSAYLYLAMAFYLESKKLMGSGKWMRKQAQEEVNHAMKFAHFLEERGGRPVLEAIAAPKKDFGTLLQVFEESLKHEQHITSCIHSLYELAGKEKDLPFQSFLKWFIDEQVEEEAAAQEVIDKIELIGDKNGAHLYMIDKYLGKRGEEK